MNRLILVAHHGVRCSFCVGGKHGAQTVVLQATNTVEPGFTRHCLALQGLICPWLYEALKALIFFVCLDALILAGMAQAKRSKHNEA